MMHSNYQPGLVELVTQGVCQLRAYGGHIIFGKCVRETEVNGSALAGDASDHRQKIVAPGDDEVNTGFSFP